MIARLAVEAARRVAAQGTHVWWADLSTIGPEHLAPGAVVLDAPPTGRIAQFLNVNNELAGLAKVGPIKSQADRVMTLLRSPQTAVHLVTVLEEMPVQETADGIAELRAASLPVGAVIVNQVRPQDLSAADLEAARAGTLDRARIERDLAVGGLEARRERGHARELGDEQVRERLVVALDLELEAGGGAVLVAEDGVHGLRHALAEVGRHPVRGRGVHVLVAHHAVHVGGRKAGVEDGLADGRRRRLLPGRTARSGEAIADGGLRCRAGHECHFLCDSPRQGCSRADQAVGPAHGAAGGAGVGAGEDGGRDRASAAHLGW